MQLTKHRLNKLHLALVAVMFIMLSLILLNHPLPVHAGEVSSDDASGTVVNITGNDDATHYKDSNWTAADQTSGGWDKPNTTRSGWIFYVENSGGEIESPRIFINSAGGGLPAGYNTFYLRARTTDKSFKPADAVTSLAPEWGAPYTAEGQSRAGAVRQYLMTPWTTPKGVQQVEAAHIVQKYFGNEFYKKFVDPDTRDDYYLVMDSCTWHTVTVGSFFGEKFIFSAYGLGIMEEQAMMGEYGQGTNLDEQRIREGTQVRRDTSWFDNDTLQITIMLDKDWPGLAQPPGEYKTEAGGTRISWSNIQNFGFGELAVQAMEPLGVKTYNSIYGKNTPTQPENGKEYDPPHTGICNITKTYYIKDTETGKVKRELESTTSTGVSNLISICDEPGFTLEAWKVSTDYNASVQAAAWWGLSDTRNGEGTAEVELDTTEGESTVYVLLYQTENEPIDSDINYILNESQITRLVTLNNPDNIQGIEVKSSDQKIGNYYFKWLLPAHDPIKCEGHEYSYNVTENYGDTCALCATTCTDDDCDCDGTHYNPCSGHTVTKKGTDYCTGWGWKDQEIKFALKGTTTTLSTPDNQQKAQIAVMADSGAFKPEVILKGNKKSTQRVINYTRGKTGKLTKSYKNWDYAFVIMRGEDKLTIADWKNQGKELGNIGFNVANTTTMARSHQGKENGGDDIVQFSLRIDDDDSKDKTTVYGPTTLGPNSKEICPTSTVNAALSNPVNIAKVSVKVKCFSGTGAGRIEKPQEPEQGTLSNGHVRVKAATISFRPYIAMRYDTRTAEQNKKAYVLSQFPKEITVYDYASVTKIKGGSEGEGHNVDVESSQWSTHASAGDKYLPGGATYSLTTGGRYPAQVEVKSYIVLLEEGTDGYKQVMETGGENPIKNGDSGLSTTMESVKAKHAALVASVENDLKRAILEQYVNTGGSPFSGLNINKNGRKPWGVDISSLGNGSSKTSEDFKYYLHRMGVEDLDPVGSANLSVTHGSTAEHSESYWAKAEDSADISSSAYDKQTQVYSQLRAALERGHGKDGKAGEADLEAPTWYNEAFDGIKVIEQTTIVSVGLKEPDDRVALLDPKLIPKEENKGNMLNNAFVTAYKTEQLSSVGSFVYPTELRGMDTLLVSDTFYIPNMTVQDLN